VIRVTLKGLLGRKLRLALTSLAIVLGVGMVSGTYVLTDTINAGIGSLLGVAYAKASAVVTGNAVFGNTGILPVTDSVMTAKLDADKKTKFTAMQAEYEQVKKTMPTAAKALTVAGIMSGTSADGIDVAVVKITPRKSHPVLSLIAHQGFPYPPSLRTAVLAAMNATAVSTADLARIPMTMSSGAPVEQFTINVDSKGVMSFAWDTRVGAVRLAPTRLQ